MFMRKVNAQLLARLIKKTAPHSLRGAAQASGVCVSLLKMLKAGKYPSEVKETTRAKICQHFKVSEDKLFPRVQDAEKAKAS